MKLLRGLLLSGLDQLHQTKHYALEQSPHHVGLRGGRSKANKATC